jgi:hypothetical protein
LKTVLIFVDHGLTLGYYLFTGLAEQLTTQGVRLVFLVENELIERLRKDYAENKLLVFESARETECLKYQNSHQRALQEMIEYVRGASMSPRIPMTYVDTHRRRKEYEAKSLHQIALKAVRPLIFLLRTSKIARRTFRWMQNTLFSPQLFTDLLDKYKPDLVISSTAGWRLDRYLLREAKKRKIRTAMTVVGWDNPSAHGLPGADVEFANVWSGIHVWELSDGLDWPKEKLHIGGMPLYDGYINQTWLIPRDEYFKMHGLDPDKKLIAYAATALSISPNLHIVEELTRIITENRLSVPAQLLIRLHPNHFKSQKHYREEREKIYEVTRNCPDVHVVAPKALAGGLPRYSGEDFPEKASMLAHCDVLVTIYSTMVVEAALYDKPLISVCIDSPTGWPENFWIPLHEVPSWPTASRVNKLSAGMNAFTSAELIIALDAYLSDPSLHRENRQKFVEQEITFLHGEATGETAKYLLKLLEIEK